ncbi:MAG: sigma-70 family RNA polymerase sigma factor [Pirellulaceae bacterium]
MQQTSDNDRKLIGDILSGHAAGWERFVLAFQDLILARVYQTLRIHFGSANRTDQEDIAAEIFAALLEHDLRRLRSFRFESTLATWLSVVAHRTTLRWVSRSLREQRWKSEFDERAVDATEGKTFESKEDIALLKSGLAELNPKDRQLLQMFFFEKRSYQEIGSVLAISVNSVGPKLQRAKRRLREIIEQK